MFNRKNVELKKVNSKHIFKSTLTPQLQRKSTSVDSGIDKDSKPTNGKLNRKDNVNTLQGHFFFFNFINVYLRINLGMKSIL